MCYRIFNMYSRRSFENYHRKYPEEFTDDVTSLVRQLCDPDPRERGHPKNKIASTKYSLERYVSTFDLLAKRAEWATRSKFLIKQVDQ